VLQEQPLLQPTEASVSPLPSEKQSHSHFLAFYLFIVHIINNLTQKNKIYIQDKDALHLKTQPAICAQLLLDPFVHQTAKGKVNLGSRNGKRHKRSRSIRNIYEQSLAAPELSSLDAHNLNADNSNHSFPCRT